MAAFILSPSFKGKSESKNFWQSLTPTFMKKSYQQTLIASNIFFAIKL